MLDSKTIIDNFARDLKRILADKLEDLKGGPKDWPNDIVPDDNNDEEDLINVWNAAVQACIDAIKP